MGKSAEEPVTDWKTASEAKDAENFLAAFPDAVPATLVLPYEPDAAINRERDTLIKRVISVLKNLDKTKEAASAMNVTPDECQTILVQTLQRLCETFEPTDDEGKRKFYLINVPTTDGVDMHLRPFNAPRKKSAEAVESTGS